MSHSNKVDNRIIKGLENKFKEKTGWKVPKIVEEVEKFRYEVFSFFETEFSSIEEIEDEKSFSILDCNLFEEDLNNSGFPLYWKDANVAKALGTWKPYFHGWRKTPTYIIPLLKDFFEYGNSITYIEYIKNNKKQLVYKACSVTKPEIVVNSNELNSIVDIEWKGTFKDSVLQKRKTKVTFLLHSADDKIVLVDYKINEREVKNVTCNYTFTTKSLLSINSESGTDSALHFTIDCSNAKLRVHKITVDFHIKLQEEVIDKKMTLRTTEEIFVSSFGVFTHLGWTAEKYRHENATLADSKYVDDLINFNKQAAKLLAYNVKSNARLQADKLVLIFSIFPLPIYVADILLFALVFIVPNNIIINFCCFAVLAPLNHFLTKNILFFISLDRNFCNKQKTGFSIQKFFSLFLLFIEVVTVLPTLLSAIIIFTCFRNFFNLGYISEVFRKQNAVIIRNFLKFGNKFMPYNHFTRKCWMLDSTVGVLNLLTSDQNLKPIVINIGAGFDYLLHSLSTETAYSNCSFIETDYKSVLALKNNFVGNYQPVGNEQLSRVNFIPFILEEATGIKPLFAKINIDKYNSNQPLIFMHEAALVYASKKAIELFFQQIHTIADNNIPIAIIGEYEITMADSRKNEKGEEEPDSCIRNKLLKKKTTDRYLGKFYFNEFEALIKETNLKDITGMVYEYAFGTENNKDSKYEKAQYEPLYKNSEITLVERLAAKLTDSKIRKAKDLKRSTESYRNRNDFHKTYQGYFMILANEKFKQFIQNEIGKNT